MNRTLSRDVQFSNGELGISQCVWCRHRSAGGRQCRAFPAGIPDAIASNRHDHRHPYDGDSGVRFEVEEVEIEFVDDDEEDTGRVVPLSVDLALETAPSCLGGASCGFDDEIVELDEIEFELDPDDLARIHHV